MTKLTALVITYNEVENIDGLINNLSFADECIVVDSFSTDGTYEKLKTHKHITTYQHAFKNFAHQKNYALSLANNDWVLFVDADERVPEKLKTEITQILSNPENSCVAYYSKFQYYYGKKPIRFSGFETAKSYRLFRVSKCKYNPEKPVHEELLVNGKSGLLSHKIQHYSFRDYRHYKEKMKRYAHLKAIELHKKGKKVTFFKKHLKPAYRFFNHYLLRLGILDGKIGYIISKLNAYEVKERFKELNRLNNNR